MRATISAVSHFLPDDVYDNHWFESRLDTSDEWIQTRTGIKERRFLREGGVSEMLVPAAQKCLQQRGLPPEEIDCIIVATVTADRIFPSTAAIVQRKLGAKNAWGFDLAAACSGFLNALITAAKLVESGAVRNVLLCSGDKMSAIVDFQDRATAVLFGDGAGAVLVEPSTDESLGILDFILRMDGNGEQYLHQKAGGSMFPPTAETVANREHYIFQDGQPVFKAAVVGMADVSYEILERNGLSGNDVAWLVPHQANLRIIDATAKRMNLSPEKVMVNIDKYGNTTAGTIPICLSELLLQGKLKKGDLIVLSSFGAGFTWGSILIRWSFEVQNS